jgi:hypothetical protein
MSMPKGWLKILIVAVVGILALKWIATKVNIPVISSAIQGV